MAAFTADNSGIAGIFSLKLRDKHLFSKPELYISHMLGQGPQVLKIKYLQLSLYFSKFPMPRVANF